jgi:hypothetical protein
MKIVLSKKLSFSCYKGEALSFAQQMSSAFASYKIRHEFTGHAVL